MSRSLLLLVVVLGGCTPENSPLMNPGQDCMSCHCTDDKVACTASALPWTAAGTVFSDYRATVNDGVQGVHVLITDAMGKQLDLVTNEAGNFYTAEPIAYYLPDGSPGVTVNIIYGDADAGMAFGPPLVSEVTPVYAAPDQVYGHGITGKGIGCNGCHQATDFDACAGTNSFCFAPPPPGGVGSTPFGPIVVPGIDPPVDGDGGG